jgi:hypothetical protein
MIRLDPKGVFMAAHGPKKAAKWGVVCISIKRTPASLLPTHMLVTCRMLK